MLFVLNTIIFTFDLSSSCSIKSSLVFYILTPLFSNGIFPVHVFVSCLIRCSLFQGFVLFCIYRKHIPKVPGFV